MHRLIVGLCSCAALAIATADFSLARIVDWPHSGYCHHNLLHVRFLRACSWFDAKGHRISAEAHAARIRKFRMFGIADWR